jgi:hypothetical protein
VLNSKLSVGSAVEVDWTEKRYLRKRRGTPGALEIRRSESLFVRWTQDRADYWQKWLAQNKGERI